MRKIPGFRRASIKEVEALSKLPWVRDEALSTRGDEARVLPDGRVLLFVAEGNPAALYPSREALAEMRRQIAEEMAKPPVDLTRTLLPPIDDLLRDVEAHAKSLGPRLRIPDDVLDGTPESLDAVDQALKPIPWAKRQVPDLVTPLIAYVGEVMRRASGGQWTKPPGKENVPMIRAHDGRILEPFVPVVLPMVEPSRRIPLRAAVDVYLLPYRPVGTGDAGTPAP
jgi:hypothetical protein